MTDNEITREKTFSEELPYFKERIKKVFDNYHNPNGNEDPLYICVLRDSHRIVRKAEEEITRQQAEIEQWKGEANRWQNIATMDLIDKEQIKSEAIKEFAKMLKNKIKTECNPYGNPTFDYNTSIAIMHYIDEVWRD